MSLITQLQDTPAVFIFFVSVIGLAVGSFLNVVIYRLPKMMNRTWQQQCAELRGEAQVLTKYNLATPRSVCPHCAHKISILENIPIISYLVLRGRCSKCHGYISIRYPMVEFLTAFLSGFVAWYFGYAFITFATLIFVWSLIALAVIDIDTQLLPDDITLPLMWIGLLVNMKGGFTDINSAIIGAVAGYLSLWLVYWGFKLITGKEGMGYGDFKLLAAIGAWLGWSILPLVILFSSLVGTVVGLGLMIAAKFKKSVPISFGPYLVGGALIALFWGQQINHAYFRLL